MINIEYGLTNDDKFIDLVLENGEYITNVKYYGNDYLPINSLFFYTNNGNKVGYGDESN